MKAHHQIKLLVSDIDGTLVDKNGRIAEIDRLAVKKIHDSGTLVSLCTGRAARGFLNVLEELELEGLNISFDGALVCNPDQSEVIYSRPLPPGYAGLICEFADRHHMALEVFTQTDYFISHTSRPATIHAHVLQFQPVITDFANIRDNKNIVMGCIVTNSPDEEEKIKAFSSGFRDTLRFSWTWHPAYPDYHFINITAPGISKGKALEALMSRLKLEKDQVMAIGDGENDIPLLSAAGLAVAMQNSPDILKAAAGYITADIEHYGFSQAINHFFK
jgi:Cof subfamily protein (haloacid dehalogenase superfamily)